MTAAGSPPRGLDADPRLGATLDGDRTRFSVATGVAELVELCLLDGRSREERLEMAPVGEGRWQLDVPEVRAGQRYGLRVHGPFDPDRALWCEPTKLLLDPYARAFHGTAREPRSALSAGSGVDTAGLVPASVVIDDGYDWGDDDAVRPRHAWDETVIYEVHVRGATRRHPSVPEALRGTYAGLAHDAFVGHLLDLGVTAVELLPVHELVDEGFLVDAGRSNYWGYNPIGYFAPAARYAASAQVGAQVGELKAMVAALHRAGLEVILDVVYNHTAEGDVEGPTLSFRGLDAHAYYRHDAAHRLVDTTGCGNSVNAASPIAVQLVVDSLRYWVATCHVDGFRFDLAPTLCRPDGLFDPAAPILERCAADPLLAGTKLICEPWDVGCEDSYALGRFPAPYREWNGRYRDVVRGFWRDAGGGVASLGRAMTGSPELYAGPGRSWTSSINYVTSHDGFTLRDLVSYEAKHNEANGEGNADGTDDNRSSNGGIEGATDDPAVLARRGRQARALLTTLLVSRGVPMLLGGDELGRTQGGNNNAYCQDNETSWLDWPAADEDLCGFVARLLALRRAHPALRGGAQGQSGATVTWRRPDGTPLAWSDPEAVAGPRAALHATARSGEGIDDVVVCVNGGTEDAAFALPADGAYVEVLSSWEPSPRSARHGGGGRVTVPARSVLVLVAETPPDR